MVDETTDEVEATSTGLPTVIGAAAIAIALVAFIVQNRADTEVTWLFLDGTSPLWIIIVISAVAGAALSEIIGWLIRRRRNSS